MDELAEFSVDSSRQDNITRILDSAERLFRHYGYGKTTVADVARDLGMSTANIYRFFASKTEIHQAVCGRMLEMSYNMALSISRLPISASGSRSKFAASGASITRAPWSNAKWA